MEPNKWCLAVSYYDLISSQTGEINAVLIALIVSKALSHTSEFHGNPMREVEQASVLFILYVKETEAPLSYKICSKPEARFKNESFDSKVLSPKPLTY